MALYNNITLNNYSKQLTNRYKTSCDINNIEITAIVLGLLMISGGALGQRNKPIYEPIYFGVNPYYNASKFTYTNELNIKTFTEEVSYSKKPAMVAFNGAYRSFLGIYTQGAIPGSISGHHYYPLDTFEKYEIETGCYDDCAIYSIKATPISPDHVLLAWTEKQNTTPMKIMGKLLDNSGKPAHYLLELTPKSSKNQLLTDLSSREAGGAVLSVTTFKDQAIDANHPINRTHKAYKGAGIELHFLNMQGVNKHPALIVRNTTDPSAEDVKTFAFPKAVELEVDKFAICYLDTIERRLFFEIRDIAGNFFGQVYHTDVGTRKAMPEIVKLKEKRFAATWSEWYKGNRSVIVRYFNDSAYPISNRIKISDNRFPDANFPDLIATTGEEDCVATFQNDDGQIVFRRLNLEGKKEKRPQAISIMDAGIQLYPALAKMDDGFFLTYFYDQNGTAPNRLSARYFMTGNSDSLIGKLFHSSGSSAHPGRKPSGVNYGWVTLRALLGGCCIAVCLCNAKEIQNRIQKIMRSRKNAHPQSLDEISLVEAASHQAESTIEV